MASRMNPYEVIQLTYTEFYDLKKLSRGILHNVKTDTNGDVVHWMKIKHLMYNKDSPHLIKFRYNFDEEFKALRVCASGRKKGKGVNLEGIYSAPLKISAAKRADLINLCDTKVIPEVYHSYCRGLPFEKRPSSSTGSDEEEDAVETEE